MNGIAADIIPANARNRPDATAIIDNGRIFTFAQHYQRVKRLGQALADAGIQPGDRLAILSRNCAEYLDIYGACEVHGFIAVPVNFRLSTGEALYILQNTGPVALFYAVEYTATAVQARSTCPGIRLCVQIDTAEETVQEPTFEQLLAGGSDEDPQHRPGADDAVYIIHTSGTTGRPRGAVLTQQGQHGTARSISVDAGLDRSDAGLIVQPLFHVGAKFIQLAHHWSGAAVILHREFDARAVWKAIETGQVTTLQVVPTMIDMLLEARAGDYPANPGLTTIFYSTAPIRESLLRRAIDVFGNCFIQQYGSTESGLISSLARAEHLPDGTEMQQRWLQSAGRPYPGIAVRICDSKNNAVPAGMTGEIVVRHENMMSCYWNDPHATGNVMQDGWLYMGDMGYVDDNGYIFLVDRKKDMIVSGGENIYPREVENTLLLHPDVCDAAVIGIPDERWGETVLACIVTTAGSTPGAEELVQHCREHMASYKKPSRIEFVDKLPRLATGKVDKVSLRRPYWADRQSGII